MSYSSWKGYNYLKTQVSAITLLSAFHYLSQWERSEDWVIFKILNIWLKDAPEINPSIWQESSLS